MSSLPSHLVSIGSRILVAGICCLGVWSSWKVARADYLFRLDTEDSIPAAMRLEPDAWRYPMRLSQFDDDHAEQLLERSLQLDAYNAPANIELGLNAENAGNYVLAEKLMLEAYAIDHTYATRWALANFYFRRGNETAFWTWAEAPQGCRRTTSAPCSTFAGGSLQIRKK